MAKTIGLKIEIDGLSQITKEVTSLEQQLKGLNDQLKNTEVGSEEYIKLKNQILLTNDALKDARKGQRDFIKDAKAADFEKGSYLDLNKQLIDLKKQYKSLSAAERESAKGKELVTKIQQLDTELKRIDGNIGQFQRNVGNYPKTFQLVTRSLTRSIPGFEAFSSVLKDAEGNLSLFGKALIGGFVAFQGAKLLNQAIKQLDEFNEKMLETRNAVAEFSGAYGEDLDKMTASTKALADTFDTDAKTISQAAKSLSKQMGISFEEALGKLEKTLVEGRGDVDEYLEKVKEFPESFIEAGEVMGEVAKQNERLLSTNKELATSQVAIAKQTKELGDNFKVITSTVKNAFLVVLIRLVEIFKPLWSSIYDLGKALYDLQIAFFGIFTGGKEAVNLLDIFTSAIKLLISPVQIAVNVLTSIVNALKPMVPLLQIAAAAIVGYRVAVVAATVATNAQKIAIVAYNVALKLYTAFTNGAKLATQAFNAAMKASPIGLIIGAATAAGAALYSMSQSEDDAAKSAEDLAEAERKAAEEAERRTKLYQERIQIIEDAYQKEKNALDLKNADGLIKEEVYNRKLVELNIERLNKLIDLNNKQIAENERLAKAGIKVTEGETEAIKTQTSNLKIELNNQLVKLKKFDADNKKRAEEAYKKLLELRERFSKQEEKDARSRAALLADLRARLNDEIIKNIEDEQKRQLATTNAGFQKQIDDLKKNYQALQLAAIEREKELVKTFGQNSAEVLKVQKANAEQLKAVAIEQAKIKEELEKQNAEAIAKINSDFRKKELDEAKKLADEQRAFRDEALNSEIQFIDSLGEQRELKNKEVLNRLLIQETDAKKREELIRLAADCLLYTSPSPRD